MSMVRLLKRVAVRGADFGTGLMSRPSFLGRIDVRAVRSVRMDCMFELLFVVLKDGARRPDPDGNYRKLLSVGRKMANIPFEYSN